MYNVFDIVNGISICFARTDSIVTALLLANNRMARYIKLS